MNGETSLLEVTALRTEFRMREGTVHAVNGIAYSLRPGDAFGIVGESGCGKSVSVLSLMRLIDEPPGYIAGSARFDGRDLLKLSHDEMRHVRGRQIAMIFQDPMTSLNPVLTVGLQLAEALREHLGLDDAAAGRRAVELLELVGIPSARERINAYPHQFSGGMRQRVMIAMAVSCDPKLLIADEPTTALDVTIQAQILDLMRRLRRELGTAVILITHDLGVVAGLCDRVAVMYAGYFVEESPVVDLFDDPRHPYTLGLLRSIPRIDRERTQSLTPIEGAPPDLVNLSPGCPFAPRCRFSIARCQTELPALVEHSPGRGVRCWVDVRTGAPV
jgi:oligopeptide transport system ATP-binding protein